MRPLDVARSRVLAPHLLQVRVTEYHELRACVHVIPFNEGEVHAPDPLQTREVRAPLPVIGVLLQQQPLQTLLLAAAGGTKSRDFLIVHRVIFEKNFFYSIKTPAPHSPDSNRKDYFIKPDPCCFFLSDRFCYCIQT